MNRRSLYTVLAGGLTFAVSGLKLAYAAKRSKEPSNAEEALKLLQQNGIINEGMTLGKIEAISARLNKEIGGSEAGKSGKWKYIDISDNYVGVYRSKE